MFLGHNKSVSLAVRTVRNTVVNDPPRGLLGALNRRSHTLWAMDRSADGPKVVPISCTSCCNNLLQEIFRHDMQKHVFVCIMSAHASCACPMVSPIWRAPEGTKQECVRVCRNVRMSIYFCMQKFCNPKVWQRHLPTFHALLGQKESGLCAMCHHSHYYASRPHNRPF